MSIALINDTDFPAFGFDTELYDSREYYCVSVKASFELKNNSLILQEDQSPMVMNDEYLADPASSGIITPSDISPYRQNTDILISGSARAPGGGAADQWLAEMKIGNIYKAIKITGHRQWQHRAIRGWELSEIIPVSNVRLLYENAYGGEIITADDKPRDAWLWNPVGRGFFGHSSPDKNENYIAPQILAKADVLSNNPTSNRLKTVGFGAIPAHWSPRLERIGTTDKHWQEKVLPHLPSDFDLRFFNCAPDDQQVQGYLRGDEEVSLSGLFDETVTFKLPNYKATALMVDHQDIVISFPMDLTAVHIDMDAALVSLVWSLTIPADEWSQASISVMER